jgi:hypothetical protein
VTPSRLDHDEGCRHGYSSSKAAHKLPLLLKNDSIKHSTDYDIQQKALS